MPNTKNINLINFLKIVKNNNNYKEKLFNKISYLKKIKTLDFKSLSKIFNQNKKNDNSFNNIIKYIVTIQYTKKNTLLQISDFNNNLIFFCSGGHFLKGKQKVIRMSVFKNFFKVISYQLLFLRNVPIALHLKNVGSHKVWILDYFKTKFFVKVVKSFELYPHNGCRKKKVKRKKNKKKIIIIQQEEMAEWFKASDCKSVELYLVVGSNPTFFTFIILCDILIL